MTLTATSPLRLYDTISAHGACRGTTIDFFSDKPATIEAAKAICRRCAVQAECLAYAKAAYEQIGVWGGLDEIERRGRPLVPRCPSCDGHLVPASTTTDKCLECGRTWAT